MAKKNSKFNFSDTPAAAETAERMDFAQQPINIAAPAIGKKSARTSGEGWTLVQARVPNDLHRRMNVYCAANNVKKGDLLAAALREYMDKLDGRR